MSSHPKPPARIEGERIVLQARAVEQAGELFALIDASRVQLRPWMPWEEKTTKVEDSIEFLKQAVEKWDRSEFYDFTIYEKKSNRMLGSGGFHALNWEMKSCEIGYWIGQAFEGQGFVNEAVKLFETAAFNLGFHRIVIRCDRLNLRSQNVATRLGYRLEGVLIDEGIHKDRFRDTLTFAKFLNAPVEGEITINLPFGFSMKECGGEEFFKVTQGQFEKIYDDNELILRTRDILSETEKAKLRSLNVNFKHPYENYLLLFCKGQLAGWSWGYQDSRESYYMVNSAILPEFRGRGLYSRMLDHVVENLVSKGYQRIWSRHNITNNSIIIPKLKRGFVVTGTEINDVFGVLLHLTYYTNKTRKKVLDFRAGRLRPDQELKNIFKI